MTYFGTNLTVTFFRDDGISVDKLQTQPCLGPLHHSGQTRYYPYHMTHWSQCMVFQL